MHLFSVVTPHIINVGMSDQSDDDLPKITFGTFDSVECKKEDGSSSSQRPGESSRYSLSEPRFRA